MDKDIIIIGAGPAGLCFARAIADTGLKILLIEKQSKADLSDPAYDGREIALTHLSHKILNELGIWDRIPSAQVSLIKAAEVVNGGSPYALQFNHEETGKDNLGFMLSNSKIRKAAYEAAMDCENIEIMYETEVANLGTDARHGWVELKDGQTLKAPLLIAADSRFSATRRMMGISTSMLDFGRTCIVCTMGHENSNRATAVECFEYDRTLAILPLNNQQISLVITINTDDSDAVIDQSPEAFADDIMTRTEGRFGQMNLSSELFTYPLVATFAKQFYANRFALIGDAAVGMHPVTAHGFNLGLRGAHTLAHELKSVMKNGEDFAALGPLVRYSDKHRRTCAPLYHGTNTLVKLYTNGDNPAAKLARSALLRLGNNIGPAKKMIMNQLTEIDAL